MNTRFADLPLGARFEFRGRRYEKLAADMARDEERCGNLFHDNTDVFADSLNPGAARVATLRTVPIRAAKQDNFLPYARKSVPGMGARGRIWADC